MPLFFSKTEILDVLFLSVQKESENMERKLICENENSSEAWNFPGKKKPQRQETAEKVCGKMGCEEWKERPTNVRWFGVL